jgi:hypothetical protein
MMRVLLACLAGLVVVSAAAASSSLPRLSACGDGFAVRPDYVLLGCGDGGQFLADVRWSDWGRGYAHGTAIWWQNLCTPDCATGNFRRDRVRITLSRPRTCRRPALRLFTRMTLRPRSGRATIVKVPYFGATRCP